MRKKTNEEEEKDEELKEEELKIEVMIKWKRRR